MSGSSLPWAARHGRYCEAKGSRQFFGIARDPEQVSVWLEGDARFEPSGINGVEPESIDQLQDRGDRVPVIACRSQGEAIGRAAWTLHLPKLEVAEVVEALHDSR